MVFYPPKGNPGLTRPAPDTISVADFLLDDEYGRYPSASAQDPFVCGLSGKRYSAREQKQRVEYLARGIAQETGWKPDQGTEWDKVVGLFSVNTVSSYSMTTLCLGC